MKNLFQKVERLTFQWAQETSKKESLTWEESPVSFRDILYTIRLLGAPNPWIVKVMLFLFSSANKKRLLQGGIPEGYAGGDIYTHVNPDVDSLACIFGFFLERLGGVPRNVEEFPHMKFVPVDSNPLLMKKDEAWDLKCGVKGDRTSCAFKRMSQKKNLPVDPRFIQEVDEGDTTGNVKKPFWTMKDLFDGYPDPDGALEVFFVLRTAQENRRRILEEGRKKISGHPFVETRSGALFLLLDQGSHGDGLPEAANELGYTGHIFQDGLNLGVSRYPGKEEPDLKTLKGVLQEEGWFFHPDGFLAAWGTRKSPKAFPSRYSFQDLANLVKESL